MIGDQLRDDAVSIAKRNSDSEVGLRHVLAAMLANPDLQRVVGDEVSLPTPETALGPKGSSIESPVLTEEASGSLERCRNLAAAADELRSLLGNQAPPSSASSAVAAPLGAGTEDPAEEPGDVAAANSAHEQQQTDTGVTAGPEAALSDLDRLIGLDSVKREIHSLTEVHRLNTARAERGLSVVPAGLHLVFTGNPGTGKTTVARVVARIYAGLGLLPRGHLVEVQRADLVAGYVGQSALKVQQVIQRARGGVLFIDEAYSLVGTDNDFGPEVIATLLTSMENLRGELAVIVAGYAREMEIFVNSNPGLQSRFQRFVEFPDYDTQELLQIFGLLADEHGIAVSADVEQRLAAVIAATPSSSRAGNGRLMRNLFEEMYGRMAVRVNADGVIEDHELEAFHPDDVPQPGDPGADGRPGNYI